MDSSTAIDRKSSFFWRSPDERSPNYAERRTSRFRFDVPSGTSVVDKRTAYTYEALQEAYPLGPVPPPRYPRVRESCYAKFARYLPILHSLRTYERTFFWSDMLAGLLVGFLHVPQSLAYSLLADLPLISGVYTSLIPVVIYTIFGTSVHISMGTNSIVSIITADMVHREVGLKLDTFVSVNTTGRFLSMNEMDEFKLGLAMASTFLTGVMFLVMGIFRLGFLTSYLPSSFIGGFTMGAGVHIGTTQIPKALNIKITHPIGWGKVLQTYFNVFVNIEKIHYIDLAIASSTLFTIVFFTNIINPRLKPKAKFEVPINLVVVIIGTIVSFKLDLNDKYDVAIIGDIPDGFPKPVFPDPTMMKNVLTDSIIMVMVTFSLNISMAILIGRIHHQEVKANSELIAYGMCNLLSSPFQCHVSSTSPPRCMLLHNDKASSMFHSVPTAGLLLLVVLGLGHSLEHLPISVLAAVVLAAIRGLLTQGRQLPNLWRVSKSDFAIWTLTFVVTAFVDISVGLVFGISSAFAVVVITNQRVEGSVIVKANSEDIFIHGKNRIGVHHLPNIRIFFFPSQLRYFNADIFKAQLFESVLNPVVVDEVSYAIRESESDLVMVDEESSNVRCIILDCSAITHVDMDGINMLKLIVVMYHKAAIQILMVRCLQNVYETLERADFFSVLPSTCVFYDLIDALKYEQYTREGVTRLTAVIQPGSRHNFTINIPSASSKEDSQAQPCWQPESSTAHSTLSRPGWIWRFYPRQFSPRD